MIGEPLNRLTTFAERIIRRLLTSTPRGHLSKDATTNTSGRSSRDRGLTKDQGANCRETENRAKECPKPKIHEPGTAQQGSKFQRAKVSAEPQHQHIRDQSQTQGTTTACGGAADGGRTVLSGDIAYAGGNDAVMPLLPDRMISTVSTLPLFQSQHIPLPPDHWYHLPPATGHTSLEP